MLFLIDDQQTEVGEFDRLRQQGMRADDDVDVAVGEALFDLGRVLGGHHARQLADFDRQTGETGGECTKMLAGQQRGRHDDRDLSTGHGCNEGGAECHLGLAETHVAADQAIHRFAGGQIFQHVGDRARLILGFGEGEAGAEFVPGTLGRGEDGGVAHHAGGGDADQLPRHIADPLLHLGFARLPAQAAEFIECDALRFAAKARENFDVLDGQKELFAAVVDQP